MIVEFYDREDKNNLRNGDCISNAREADILMDELRSRTPFFCELVGSHGYRLMVGLGCDLGCVQYSASDGTPPYMMARASAEVSNKEEYLEFLTGGTLTPVERQYCVPFDSLKEIVAEFVQSGQKSSLVDWEEI